MKIIAIAAAALSVLAVASCSSSPAPTPQAETQALSSADSAACEELRGFFDQANNNVPISDIQNPDGWPAGEPSEAVRGAFNQWRSVQANWSDFLDGVLTQEEMVASIDTAYFGYQSACRA